MEERAKSLRAELVQQIDQHSERIKQLEEELHQSKEQERTASAQVQKLRSEVDLEREQAKRYATKIDVRSVSYVELDHLICFSL